MVLVAQVARFVKLNVWVLLGYVVGVGHNAVNQLATK